MWGVMLSVLAYALGGWLVVLEPLVPPEVAVDWLSFRPRVECELCVLFLLVVGI